MKKLLLIAASCVALAACSKTEPESKKIEGEPFKAGQVVTLSASVVDSATKVSSEISGTGEDTKIDFKWETGDKILVTVGGKSSEFTLSSTPGSNVGQFTGTMPADGTSFDVQYPVETPTTDLTNQTYSATEAFEKDRMLFTDTGCTLTEGSGSFELEAANAVLNLNLYGKNLTISKIAVKIGTKTYNLNIEPAVALGWDATEVKKFNLIVPAGSSKFTMTASVVYNKEKLRDYVDNSVNYNKGIPITKRIFTTSEANTFTAGKVTVMPDKELTTVIWAPANCGITSERPWGTYYQWGRYVGTGYLEEGVTSSTYHHARSTWTSSNPITNPNDSWFYDTDDQEKTSPTRKCDWYTDNEDNVITSWPRPDDAQYVEGKIGDPCPAGWIIPTKNDCEDLLAGNLDPAITNGNHGGKTQKGCYYDGTDSASSSSDPVVFLPAAGYLTWEGYDKENYARTQSIDYWAREATKFNAKGMNFINATTPTSRKENYIQSRVASFEKAYAFTVRCVQDGHEK